MNYKSMTPTRCQLADYGCQVVSNRDCGCGLWLLTLQSDQTSFSCLPGQFVMLALPEARFLFRRPFSVFRSDTGGRFEIFYKVVGQGTAMMSSLVPGDALKILGPLGNGFLHPSAFTDLNKSSRILLLGGGIGIAPLYAWLSEAVSAQTKLDITCVYGSQSAQTLAVVDDFKTLASAHFRLVFATDNGSVLTECSPQSDWFAGRIDKWLDAEIQAEIKKRQGHTTDSANQLNPLWDRVLMCGPMAMMKACSELLQSYWPELPIDVSLENHMPCGTGACSGCVVFPPDGRLPIKVCVEGPVLSASWIDWQAPGGMPLMSQPSFQPTDQPVLASLGTTITARGCDPCR